MAMRIRISWGFVQLEVNWLVRGAAVLLQCSTFLGNCSTVLQWPPPDALRLLKALLILPPNCCLQAACIPLALSGRDICGSAMTGSGKTAAFALPVLERLLHRPRQVAATYVLILSPTRELAAQVRLKALLCHARQ